MRLHREYRFVTQYAVVGLVGNGGVKTGLGHKFLPLEPLDVTMVYHFHQTWRNFPEILCSLQQLCQ